MSNGNLGMLEALYLAESCNFWEILQVLRSKLQYLPFFNRYCNFEGYLGKFFVHNFSRIDFLSYT